VSRALPRRRALLAVGAALSFVALTSCTGLRGSDGESRSSSVAAALATPSRTGAPAPAAAPSAAARGGQARIEQFDFTARGSGRRYRVFVSTPAEPAPAAGYAVVYCLDANLMLGTMADSVRAMSRRRGVVPAMVVGIGYPDDADVGVERGVDLTPARDDAIAPGSGGAAAFLAFLRDDLQPEIARRGSVDRTREALFGHSFGGLFTLYALIEAPQTFDIYVAASPSIWFANRHLQRGADRERVTDRLASLPRPPRVLLTVGQFEQAADPDFAGLPGAPPLSALLGRAQIDNAREFATFLQRSGIPDAAIEVIANEDHASVIPAAIGRAARFVQAPGR
jgi:uncharacterized protein